MKEINLRELGKDLTRLIFLRAHGRPREPTGGPVVQRSSFPYFFRCEWYSLIAGKTSCPSRSMQVVAVSWVMGPSLPQSTK